MTKKNVSKRVSIRKNSDYLDVRIFSGGQIVFKSGCAVNDKKKIANIINILKVKGVDLDNKGWWD